MYKKLTVFAIALTLFAGVFAMNAEVAGEKIAEAVPNGGVPGNWTGTYAPVLNATEDVFELMGDISALLSANSGVLTVLAITLVIVSLLGIIPLAFGLTLIFLAINMGKQGYNKYR